MRPKNTPYNNIFYNHKRMTMKYLPDFTISSSIGSKKKIIEIIHERQRV